MKNLRSNKQRLENLKNSFETQVEKAYRKINIPRTDWIINKESNTKSEKIDAFQMVESL